MTIYPVFDGDIESLCIGKAEDAEEALCILWANGSHVTKAYLGSTVEWMDAGAGGVYSTRKMVRGWLPDN